jgi:hypothetical protein
VDRIELTSNCGQVTQYFNFLWAIDSVKDITPPPSTTPTITSPVFSGGRIELSSILDSNSNFSIDAELKNSMKGLAFVVLYNLIEGTITEILNDSFKKINSTSTKYYQASKKFKEAWLTFKHKLFKTSNPEEIIESIKVISQDVLNFSHTDSNGITFAGYSSFLSKIGKSAEVSGNLDVRKIRELFEKYELSPPAFNSGSDKILTIKSNRNYVAHGEKKLSEVGRPYTIRELFEFKETTFAFLHECVNSSAAFQKKKPFRKLASR